MDETTDDEARRTGPVAMAGSGLPTLLVRPGGGEPVMVLDEDGETLDVLGLAVHVVVRRRDDRTVLEASIASGQPDADLRDASLAAPGDTVVTYAAHESSLRATRTLIAPSAGAEHDALHELGKLVVRLSAPIAATAPPPPPPPAPAAPQPAQESFWCFVDRTTELRAAPGSEEVVAMLVPGVWYRATRTDDAWVHVEHPSGARGVVGPQEVTPA